MQFFNKTMKKISHPIRGFMHAFRRDLSFKLDMLVGLGLLVFGYLMQPLLMFEVLFLVLSWIILMITELLNTSLETALNRLHPDEHDDIGRSKDVAAAAVIFALVFIAVVLLSILYTRLQIF